MTMKLVKKTAEYSIYLRGDERYAVKDGNKNPVNGEDKVRILAEEGLCKVPAPRPAVAEPEAEAPAAEAEPAAEEAAASEEAPAAEAADAGEEAADKE